MDEIKEKARQEHELRRAIRHMTKMRELYDAFHYRIISYEETVNQVKDLVQEYESNRFVNEMLDQMELMKNGVED